MKKKVLSYLKPLSLFLVFLCGNFIIAQETLDPPVGPDNNAWQNIGPQNVIMTDAVTICGSANHATWQEQGLINVVRFHPDFDGTFGFGQQPSGGLANLFKNTIFAASSYGGLFYSINGGATWYDYGTDELPHPGCGDLEIVSYDAGEGQVEHDFFFLNSRYYVGYNTLPLYNNTSVVYRKTGDFGAWNDAASPFSLSQSGASGMHGKPRTINDLLITESNLDDNEQIHPYKVLVASSEAPGVHYSLNKGGFWIASTFDDPDYWQNINWNNGPLELLADETDDRFIYLSGGIGSDIPAGVDIEDANILYRSVDGGVSFDQWKKIEKGDNVIGLFDGLTMSSNPSPAHNVTSYRIDQTHLVQSVSNPNRMYMGVKTAMLDFNNFDATALDHVSPSSAGLTIFFSDDHGETWTFGNFLNITGACLGYFNLCVDPQDDNRVYVGRGNTSDKVTLFSADASGNFSFSALTSDVHPDARDINCKAIGGNTFMLVGHDGGISISRSANTANPDLALEPINGSGASSLRVNRAYEMTISNQEAGRIAVPMPDNAIMESRIVNGVRQWEKIDSGDGEHIEYSAASDDIRTQITSGGSHIVNFNLEGCTNDFEIAPFPNQDDNDIWHRFPIRWHLIETNRMFLAQSTQSTNIYRILYNNTDGCGANFDLAGFEDPNTGEPVKSRINNLELDLLNPDLVMYTYFSAKMDNLNNRIVFGFVDDTGTNATVDWQVYNGTREAPVNAEVVDLVLTHPDPNDANNIRVYVAWQNEVYKSNFNLNTGFMGAWKEITEGLPSADITCLDYDLCSNTIFAGTDQGVYYLKVKKKFVGEAGIETWTKVGTGMPNCHITDLAIENALGMLYVSTWGRGVWENDVSDLICLEPTVDDERERSDVQEQEAEEEENKLVKVFPNPIGYGSTLNISFRLEKDDKVSIQVFDENGRLQNTVVSNQDYPAGEHLVRYPIKQESGTHLIIKTQIGQEVIAEKVVLIALSEKSLDDRQPKQKEDKQ